MCWLFLYIQRENIRSWTVDTTWFAWIIWIFLLSVFLHIFLFPALQLAVRFCLLRSSFFSYKFSFFLYRTEYLWSGCFYHTLLHRTDTTHTQVNAYRSLTLTQLLLNVTNAADEPTQRFNETIITQFSHYLEWEPIHSTVEYQLRNKTKHTGFLALKAIDRVANIFLYILVTQINWSLTKSRQ